MRQARIKIHLQALSELIPFSRTDFADLKSFNHAKTQTIHQQRLYLLNQYLQSPTDAEAYAQHDHNTARHPVLRADDLARSSHGKPYLPNHPELAFNHSHSQQHYALAMSHSVQDLGVDLEDLARKVRFDALAQHAFDVDEYAHWQATGQDPIYWFKVWTAKEAILKASGLGIRMSLNQLHTGCSPAQDQGRCTHAILGDFCFQHIQTDAVMLTVAWRVGEEQAALQWPRLKLVDC